MYQRDVIAHLRRELQRAKGAPQAVSGAPTGIGILDRRTSGLQDRELTVLAGRPGDGKSALAGQIAYHVAEHLRRTDAQGLVFYFSAEMPAYRLAQRYVALLTGISIQRQMSGDVSDAEWGLLADAMASMEGLPLVIDDKAALSMVHIREQVRLHRDEGIRLLIVDHLQIVAVGEQSSQYQAVTKVAHGLRELRDELSAPILALSQLNRQAEDERPRLGHLRDSGSVEEAANNVWLLSNPSPTTEEDAQRPRVAELIIAKCRDGWTGTMELRFDPERIAFLDPALAPIHLDLPGVA